MSREFPDWINPWSAAQGRRAFQGTVPMVRMGRLLKLLESEQGKVAFEVTFALDMDQRPVVNLTVEARVALMCQASLEPYEHVLQRESLLGVVEDEAEIKLLPAHYDPVLVENHRLSIAELVEDEVILGLPQIPRNPAVAAISFSTGKAPVPEEGTRTKKHPFADLREQLDKQKSK